MKLIKKNNKNKYLNFISCIRDDLCIIRVIFISLYNIVFELFKIFKIYIFF